MQRLSEPEADGVGKTLLVLGPKGMLGKAVVKAARAAGCAVLSGNYDILEFGRLTVLNMNLKPDAIINCAGIIPSKHTTDFEMVEVNAAGPHLLAAAFKSSHIVQVSTDCVFSGRQHAAYSTSDRPDPPDLYGRSKLAGELSAPHTTTVRTSFVGRDHGLLPWFLSQEGVVPGYKNVLWSGSTVNEVAKHLVAIALGAPKGLIHLAAPTVSKYDVLMDLKELFEKEDVTISPASTPHIYRNLVPTIHMPPFYITMNDLLEKPNERGAGA